MGCAQSRIDNEESVARCKDRKNLMKDAVIARNAFAAGHSGYAVALKNTGAALSDYGHGEVLVEPHHDHHHDHQSTMDPTSQTPQPPPPPPPDIDHLPPPPPLPNFSPSPSPIKRAMSMPEIPTDRKLGRRHQIGSVPITEEGEEEEEEEEHEHEHEHNANVGNRNEKNMDSKVGPPQNTADNNNNNNDNNNVRPPPPPTTPDAKNIAWDYFFMVDNIPSSSLEAENENRNETEENNVEFGEIQNNNNNDDDDVEPKTPEKAEKVELDVEVEMEKGKQIEHSNTAPVEFRRVAKTVVSSVNLMQVLSVIDDHFLKASQSAQEVCNMLEATRLHYHSNFADNRGNWIGGLF